jgi:hypothetical protein
MRRFLVLSLLAVFVSGCDDNNDVLGPLLPAPTNLFYEVEPSGDPDLPAGILLFWDPVVSDLLQVYRVYSRRSTSEPFDLRGATTSITFHDNGDPDIEYFVVAVDVDGVESEPSNTIAIAERLVLERPDFIGSTSLDGAVLVTWSDNPFLDEPEIFRNYRLYSAFFDLDTGFCDEDFVLEGTTVAPEFLASALPNGEPRCFAVSAESIERWESDWSDVIADTPRPDARNVLMFAFQADQTRSGFRFFQDANNDGVAQPLELGIVASGSSADVDFFVDRDANGDLFLVPVRTGTEIALASPDPIDDLTDIDIAPEAGYGVAAIEAVPGFGYVFQMDGGDGFARFGGLRVTHVGDDILIFDWSYQTDPGNPELSVGGGVKTWEGGIVVKRR